MQTVSSLAERLDMTAEDAAEKLRYMLCEVEGVNSVISDEECDLLIDVDDDPSIADRVRDGKLQEQERAKQATEKAAAKRKAAAKKAAAKKKATAKKRAAETKKKAAAKKKAEAEAKKNTALKKKAGGTAEAEAEAVLDEDQPAAAVVDEDRPVAEILTADVELAAPVDEAEEPIAQILTDAEVREVEVARSAAEAADEGPTIVIGSAIEHEEHHAEVVRANGTHVDVAEVEIAEGQEPVAVPEEEELGLLAEAERRQEAEEKRKEKTPAKVPAQPDPAVVAEVIRKAEVQRAKGRQRARAAVKPGTRKTGKTARKRQKKLERKRVEDTLRRDAAVAVKEYQAGGFDSGVKKRRRKRVRGADGVEIEDMGEMLVIEVEDAMTVEDLAEAMDIETTDLIIELMEKNIMATKNQLLNADLIRQLAEPKGFEVHSVIPEEEEVFAEEPDDPEDLVPRAPVVTVMGHVDHGKTSLLDRVRQASVADGEAGGITQHIAAYEIELPHGRVVFLDTPGHEAFTAMRARGARVTDVVVLVVAADDGVMPQTVEAIDHARAAEVPIVVAVNKCDKPNAQPERIRQELTRYELTDEQWGGKTIIKDISAKVGTGVDDLMELLVLETELLELKANPKKRARGTIVEAEITRGQGPVAWVLVQTGTLRVGDVFLAGSSFGRVRAMQNSRGETIEEAGPSTPVVVMGFNSPPDAGDTFVTVKEERVARAIASKRADLARHKQGRAVRHVTLEDFHAQLLAGEKQELNVLIKADVQGSVDVLESTLLKAGNEEVRVRVVHSGVGEVNESDVLLASASDAVILGFHLETAQRIDKLAEDEGVDIRTYNVIYEAVDDVRKALEGLLAPEQREVVMGHAEIRQVFKSSALGSIAGCIQLDGEARRDSLARLQRNNEVIYEGRVASLRREKDDATVVQSGFECGIKLENFDDIREGDVIEMFRIEDVAKTLA